MAGQRGLSDVDGAVHHLEAAELRHRGLRVVVVSSVSSPSLRIAEHRRGRRVEQRRAWTVEQCRGAAPHPAEPFGRRAAARVSGSCGRRPRCRARLTAMVRSALTAAIGAIGSGSRMPPSASSRPSSTCGVITPGIAIDARIAASTGPRCSQTDLPRSGRSSPRCRESAGPRSSPHRECRARRPGSSPRAARRPR